MKTLNQRIEDRIRDTICRACIYEKADGGCSLSGRMDCPIISRIDRIVEVVRSTNSSRMDEYVERLREAICSDCPMQDELGRCALREHADCTLDDYFALIVDLVEQELAAGDGDSPDAPTRRTRSTR